MMLFVSEPFKDNLILTYFAGVVGATLLELVKGIPLQSSVYTAAMMLVGDNLDGIKGMIHDLEPDTGA